MVLFIERGEAMRTIVLLVAFLLFVGLFIHAVCALGFSDASFFLLPVLFFGIILLLELVGIRVERIDIIFKGE